MERNIMSAEIVNEIEVPSYDKYCEYLWEVDWWWRFINDDMIEHLLPERGIDIDEGFYFDLYYNQCSSYGRIRSCEKFVEFYFDRLSKVSLAMTEMLRERDFIVRWRTTYRGEGLEIECEDDWYAEETFTSGIFAGIKKNELLMAESELGNDIRFEEEIKEIITDVHQEFLSAVRAEEARLTSQEEYELWVKEWIENNSGS